ncbi:hypothetical protein L6R49_02180 [Myxococcota bacterium]|nr:hypothetical protein [Myxococcota bacterium]
MSEPLLIGVLAETPWLGLSSGVLVMAFSLATQGYRVLVVDADPGAGELTDWARARAELGPAGASVRSLLRDARGIPQVLDVGVAIARELRDGVAPGGIGLVPAYDTAERQRPATPGGRAVHALRESLLGVTHQGEPYDLVLTLLPPATTGLGVALAANLPDALVLISAPQAGPLRRSARALKELAALRGGDLRVHYVELDPAEDWSPATSQAAWLHHLQAIPELRLRPSGQNGFLSMDTDRALLDDFNDLALHLREQLGLRHPDPTERVYEGDALERPELVRDGFAQLLREDREAALKFFTQALAGRAATRMSTMQAALAVAASPETKTEELLYVTWYAGQKFRLAEPDPLAEDMHTLGERVLAEARAGRAGVWTVRAFIVAADAKIQLAALRRYRNERVGELDRDALKLLLEAAQTPLDAHTRLRLAKVLAFHARVAEDARNLDLALGLIQLMLQGGGDGAVARQHTLDILWHFSLATRDARILGLALQHAETILGESPAYARYYLVGIYALMGKKREALKHLLALSVVDAERFEMFFEDGDMACFHEGIGTRYFFSPGPTKGVL